MLAPLSRAASMYSCTHDLAGRGLGDAGDRRDEDEADTRGSSSAGPPPSEAPIAIASRIAGKA